MHLAWSPAEETFRDEVRNFFNANLTTELCRAGRLMTSVYADHAASMQWQKIVAAKGWAAPAWPREYGGCDWSVAQRYIYARERIAAGAPPLSPMGIQMCGPALIGHGTAEQRTFYLPRMLSGEHFWCQGYSEPGAGSDLASLEMRAESDGNTFICNGSKIWTTHANVANWMFCLVRTGRFERNQLGITFLLIDMTSPGIEVRRITTPSGEQIQSQVFFTDVRVPKANVVGTIDQGWTVAKYLLEFERGGVAYAPELQVRLDEVRLSSVASAGPQAASSTEVAAFDRKLAAAQIRISALQIYEFRAMQDKGSTGAAFSSVMKVIGTELSQHLTELALEAAGNYGRAYQPQAAVPGGDLVLIHATGGVAGPLSSALAPMRYLNDRAGSIYAGSNEIQRNIIAKAQLRL